MRILITASTFPQRRDDGSPAFVFGLARALAARDRVTVLAPGAPGAPAAEIWDGVQVRRFDYFVPASAQRLAYGDGMETNLARSWMARLQVPALLLAEARATRSLAAELAADVVNAHWIFPQGLAAAVARGRGARFRHVVSLHGGDAHLLARFGWTHGLARFIARRAEGFLVSSRAVARSLDTALGSDSGAVVRPMGVESARFAEAPPLDAVSAGFPGGYLLYVGRLQEIKGVDVLLAALARLRQQEPGLGLLVYGYGEQEPALREAATALGVEGAVRFAGAQPPEAVAAALRGCRACVVPSRRMPGGREEGMPTVIAEALAAGAPVVATATGGIPDVIEDGRNGWLCAEGDAVALAGAIARALGPEASAVAAAGRAAGRGFDWSEVAATYRDTFARALSA